ncbi:shikimate kinase [bacterium]|nr:shikimate kinase [bacterium]
MKEKIYLCGFMGSGKTTVGKILSEKMSRTFIDTDTTVELESGMSVAEIFKTRGEDEFRRMESEVIRRLSERNESCIIALGGGSLISLSNRKLVRSSGYLIYLKTELSRLMLRLSGHRDRPLLQTVKVDTLFRLREPGYLEANWICDCEDFDAEAIADLILKKCQKKI